MNHQSRCPRHGPRRTRQACAALAGSVLSAAALAQEPAGASSPAAATAPPPAETQGILPLEDYSGDLWSRSYLLGDLWGTRTDLANKGVSFEIDWNQVVQSVAAGGRNSVTEYG